MQSPENFNGRPTVAGLSLLPAAARMLSANANAVTLDGFEMLAFTLGVTAAATEAGDTLDVYVQTTVDGTNWLDAVHFTQILGDAGPKLCIAKLSASLALTEFEAGTALNAGAVRHIFGSQWRVRWEIVDDSESASFNFSVTANAT